LKNAWLELDLTVLRDNIRSVLGALKQPAELIFVVKANAYGHGLAPVCRCAWESGVRRFAVANLDEAVSLRRLLPQAGIIVLGVIGPDDVAAALAESIEVVLGDEEHGADLAAAARACSVVLCCHAKIDTGMGRLGFALDRAADAVARLAAAGGLEFSGICSHFASSAAVDCCFAQLQMKRFLGVVDACRRNGLAVPMRHMSNSSAFLRNAAWDLDGVRVGIHLYGYGSVFPSPRSRTRPMLQWKSRLIQVKRVPAGSPVGYDSTHITPTATNIGVVPVGYADGYARRLTNQGHVLVAGRSCPVVGRVSMNFITVDLGPEGAGRAGDEVVLMGQQGEASVWADQLAAWCETIPYEILTSIRSPGALATPSH